jgi:replication factor A2
MGGFLENNDDHPFQGVNQSPTSKGPSSANSSSTRPLSIKQILDAPLSPQEAQVCIDGVPTGEITLVACITAIKSTETFRAFSLEDGTGTIDGKHWKNSTSFDGQTSNDADSSDFREGIWVRIFGTLKPFNGTKGLNITHMRQIVEFNEITFHNLAVIEAHLVLSGASTSGGGGGAGGAGGKGAFYDSYGSPLPAATNSMQGISEFVSQTIAQFTPVQREVYQYYRQASNTPNGLHKNDVIKFFRGRYGHTEVLAAHQFLIEDGYIYITCDDNHAKCS